MSNLMKLVLAVLLVLPACDPSDTRPADPVDRGVVVLAKAEGWRVELMGSDVPYGLAEVAFDDAAARRAWEENVPNDLPRRDGDASEPGLYDDFDRVDLDTHAILVWSSGESGTCPEWLAGVERSGDTVDLVTEGEGGNGICTLDYRPYRMVLAVERGRLPAEDDLPVEAQVDGELDGRIVPYPSNGQ